MPSANVDLLTRVAHACQLSLGLVFLVAVLPKLRAPSRFARTVAEYRLVPRAATPALARGLIAIEAFLALAFLSGMVVRLAAPLALVMLSAFAAAVGINLRRKRKIDCGCFGTGGETISGRSLGRLAMLLLAAALVTVATSVPAVAPMSLTSLPSGKGPGIDELVETGGLSLGLLLVGMWVLHLPELRSAIGLQRRSPRRGEVQQRGEAV
jgi:Methylamine utilisation protein MauE